MIQYINKLSRKEAVPVKKHIALIFSMLVILTALTSVHVRADEEPILPIVIDDMASASVWDVPSLNVSQIAYTDETSAMASSETDGGYLCFAASGLSSGSELSATRHLDEPINLYNYSAISFNYYIPSSETTSSVAYNFTVTLASGASTVSSSFAAVTDKWTTAEIAFDTWHKRNSVDAITITVSPIFDSETSEKLNASFCVDGITASRAADTSYEDRFMTASFSIKDGTVTNYADGTVLWRRAAASSISANISYSSVSEALGHNTLRVVLSANTDTELHFSAIYEDGTVYEGKSQTVSEGSGMLACYFSFPSPEKALRFAIASDTELGGTVTLYGIDTLYMPVSIAPTVLGTLDVCAFDADGSLNLRGTISSDTVAEHINGSICIYAVPLYAETEETVLTSEPIAKATMTTRFNLTIDAASLPDGSAAMKYAVVISDKSSLISVCEPLLPETKKAGASVPVRSNSIKGITNADISHEAGLTEITVELNTLFGTPSSSKIYSAFGELYYFSSEQLSELDSAVKAVSLSGTGVYLRLTRGATDAALVPIISADDEKSFRELYAAVDFLTSRYSSDEYGYVSGMIVGNSPTDVIGSAVFDATAVKSFVMTAAVVYGAGGLNIADFNVIFPVNDTFVSVAPSLMSSELMLRLITSYTEEIGLSDYGILWQTDSVSSTQTKYGISSLDYISKYISSLGGNSPQFYFLKYTPSELNLASRNLLLKSVVPAYFAACSQSSVQGFILNAASAPDVSSDNDFAKIFAELDTNMYESAVSEIYASEDELPRPSAAAEKRAFARTVSSITASTSVGTVGSAVLFDYNSSFYTGGWFSLSRSGECMTVKADNGRVLRCTGGVMFSSATSPIDLSSAPVLSFELYGSTATAYTFTLISAHSTASVDVNVSESAKKIYIDLSEFYELSAVTGIILRPKDTSDASLFIKNIHVNSHELTDAELSEIFNANLIGKPSAPPPAEENIVEIIAVISAAAIVSAMLLILLRSRSKKEQD